MCVRALPPDLFRVVDPDLQAAMVFFDFLTVYSNREPGTEAVLDSRTGQYLMATLFDYHVSTILPQLGRRMNMSALVTMANDHVRRLCDQKKEFAKEKGVALAEDGYAPFKPGKGPTAVVAYFIQRWEKRVEEARREAQEDSDYGPSPARPTKPAKRRRRRSLRLSKQYSVFVFCYEYALFVSHLEYLLMIL